MNFRTVPSSYFCFMQRVIVCFRRCLPTVVSLVMGLAAAGMGGAAAAATLTSRDGKKRDFPVVVAAAGPGLTVRESAGGRDVLIPWERMDLAVSMEANEWLRAAHAKAVAGGVVALNLGLEEAAGAEAVAEWRTVRSVVEGGGGPGVWDVAIIGVCASGGGSAAHGFGVGGGSKSAGPARGCGGHGATVAGGLGGG